MRSPVLPPPHLVSCHHLSSLLSTYAVQEDSPCTDLASRASPPASRLSGPSVRWASTRAARWRRRGGARCAAGRRSRCEHSGWRRWSGSVRKAERRNAMGRRRSTAVTRRRRRRRGRGSGQQHGREVFFFGGGPGVELVGAVL